MRAGRGGSLTVPIQFQLPEVPGKFCKHQFIMTITGRPETGSEEGGGGGSAS